MIQYIDIMSARAIDIGTSSVPIPVREGGPASPPINNAVNKLTTFAQENLKNFHTPSSSSSPSLAIESIRWLGAACTALAAGFSGILSILAMTFFGAKALVIGLIPTAAFAAASVALGGIKNSLLGGSSIPNSLELLRRTFSNSHDGDPTQILSHSSEIITALQKLHLGIRTVNPTLVQDVLERVVVAAQTFLSAAQKHPMDEICSSKSLEEILSLSRSALAKLRS